MFSFVSRAKHFLIETDDEDGQLENGSVLQQGSDYAGEFLFFFYKTSFVYLFFSSLQETGKVRRRKRVERIQGWAILQKRGETKNILLFNFTGAFKCKCHDGNEVLCSQIFTNLSRMYLLYKILFLCLPFFSNKKIILESINILYCKAKV